MIRLIARLDIKGPNLIKGVQLEGLRVMGDPQLFAKKYYDAGIDEIIYIDSVASLYGRNNLTDIVRHTAKNVFVPMTVGGGIRSLDDVKLLLKSGADKVALNTAAVANPNLITQIAKKYGSQCVVLSVEAKRTDNGSWEVLTDNGREKTGLDVLEWIPKAISHGAGEILLTSVDQEGTKKGFDIKLLAAVSKLATVPVIASGGMGKLDHLQEALQQDIDGLAFANVLHYDSISLDEMRDYLCEHGHKVRKINEKSHHH